MVKEKATSLTDTTDAIFIASVINAKGDRQVAAINLHGAFLHAGNDEDVIMFMRGRLAKLRTMVALQTYQKFVTIKHRQSTVYQGAKGIVWNARDCPPIL